MSTDPKRAKITARIAACLALASDEGAPIGEREAAAAKAAALMAKHGINEAQAAAARGDAPEGITSHPVALVNGDGHGKARAFLAAKVAEAMDCKAIHMQRSGSPKPSRSYTVAVLGATSDVQSLRLLLPLILAQAQAAAATTTTPEQRQRRDFFPAFLLGYGEAVAARIAERRAPLVDPSTNPGAAVILADRAARLDAFMAERFGELGSVNASTGTGRDAGHAAGRRANLGDPSVTNATGRELSP